MIAMMTLSKYALLCAVLVACGGKQKTSDGDDNGPSVVGMQDNGDSTDRSHRSGCLRFV